MTKDARTLDHTIVKADASTAYIAIDFVKQYSDFDYTVYDQPNRVVLTNQWGDYNTAPVKKSTELRYQGGIKSPILADLAKGTVLTVLEPDETWTKVMTEDGIIGYVKTKALGCTSTATRTSDYTAEEFSHIKKDFSINLGLAPGNQQQCERKHCERTFKHQGAQCHLSDLVLLKGYERRHRFPGKF